jgi:hypothetical protein
MTKLHRPLALVLSLLSAFAGAAACSGSGATGASSSGGGSPGGSGPGSSSSGAGAGGGSALGGPFRYGVNGGHRNASWGNDKDAILESQSGCNGQRILLPEWLFDQWGYDIEIKNNDMQSYQAGGLTNLIAFVNGPIAAHSTAPAGLPQWQLDYYIPKNLYEPTLNPDQTINPNNFWGAYIYKTVSQYKQWVKVWEVWNEPDWVSDYQVTLTWDSQPPQPAELPRFNGSIFDYIRMLRVTREAARAADPEAKIATGGLGYPSFLSAIARYTDNPKDGSVTAEYPKKGGDYFDVMSFHYYPLYTPGNSDAAADGFIKQRDAMAKVLSDAGVAGKEFTSTETGAPHQDFMGQPSGAVYARSYLIKMMTLAQAAGMLGVDWFALSDGGDLQSPYSFMGLYQDIANLGTPDQAVPTDNGYAYRTLGGLLKGARYDGAATAALGLPSGARGAAFKLESGREGFVLWATAPSGEQASATALLATSSTVVAYAWDYSKTKATSMLSPAGGQIQLSLTSSPQIFIEQ